MKYAFVSLGILAIWVSIILIVVSLNYDRIILPVIGLFMTVIMFLIGFGGNK